VDHYGNCITGIPAAGISPSSVIATGIAHIPHARTFSDAEPGRPCWYANSIGLLEVAVNGGNAANQLGLGIGSELSVH
jgi:S-adenosylmethionine hydrolase